MTTNIIVVTPFQREVAQEIVRRGKLFGTPVDPAVVKIAEAQPLTDEERAMMEETRR